MRKFILIPMALALALLSFNIPKNHPAPAPLPMPVLAHSHNDYQHDHPLWDALHLGYRSIEVDVHLKAGIFFVGHDPEDIRPFKTLKSMYLEPLRKLIESNGGGVYEDGSGIVLLIDVKTDSIPAWIALNKVLNKYSEIISGLNEGSAKPVVVIVSGNRDLSAMSGVQNKLAWYDGRLDDLQTYPNKSIISMISISWTEEFSWAGENRIPEAELMKLNSIIALAHSQNRKVRFWGTDCLDANNQKQLWDQLSAAGVDVIGTDKLEEFRLFTVYQ